MVREYTNKLGELIDQDYLSYEQVFEEITRFFSEEDIQGFCEDGFGGEIRDEFNHLEGDVRQYTNKLGELVDEGILSAKSVVDEMMAYFSEDDIKSFCEDGFAGELSEHFEDL